jgi:flagellar basal-body rod modification protein FlgD
MATTITPSDNAASSIAQQAAAPANKSVIAADFDMFLKMLTTQMQNQDPLSPMDTAQYTQQLVQFSQVEQSMQQTDALKNMLAAMSAQSMAQSAGFIGQQARFDTPVSGLSAEGPATWTYAVDGAPAALTATVKDNSTGTIVRTVTLPADAQGSFSWDGLKDDGGHAVNGAYALEITAFDANGKVMLDGNGQPVKATINATGKVKEVVTDGSNVVLSVNGLRYPAASMVAVAAPTMVASAGN